MGKRIRGMLRRLRRSLRDDKERPSSPMPTREEQNAIYFFPGGTPANTTISQDTRSNASSNIAIPNP